jgi:hypothetical protein
MNRTTAAERYNKRMNNIFDTYHRLEAAKSDILPTCSDYAYFLETAVNRLKISKDTARNKYGQLTYKQWKELLNL